MVERICTPRPPKESAELASLMANQWVYLDRKKSQLIGAGFGEITKGLFGAIKHLRAHGLQRDAPGAFIPVGGRNTKGRGIGAYGIAAPRN